MIETHCTETTKGPVAHLVRNGIRMPVLIEVVGTEALPRPVIMDGKYMHAAPGGQVVAGDSAYRKVA